MVKNLESVKENIRNYILQGDYDEAEILLKSHLNDIKEYDDIFAILDASIGDYCGDNNRVWNAISKGLLYNHKNYELYVMLGNYYLNKNPYQAYLCYENALFYCDDKEDGQAIEALLIQLEEDGIVVNKVAFVILSFNLLYYTKLCINSIRATVPAFSREIIVVDNASKDGSVEWLREQNDVLLIENDKNVGFPIGCNQGIAKSGSDTDILLLNNDTVLTDNAVFWLRMGLYEREDNGTAGSVSNNVVNYQTIASEITDVEELLAFGKKNNVPMLYPYEEKLFLIGFALLIKREVIEKIGDLDERFTPGNSEDIDYGLRVLTAGYRNVLCRNSFIIHFGSKSFGRDKGLYSNLLAINKQKLNEKWGMDTSYYLYPRLELINLINEPKEKEMKFLDVGCGCGATMARIKSVYPNAITYGIEIVPKVAEIAGYMGEVTCEDVEKLEFAWGEESFDYVIMGDVLEHLRTPEIVLKRIYKLLKPGGYIIVSMPNVKHYSVMLPLIVHDKFSYGDAGILDRTHLKMYTGTEISKLIKNSGYQIEEMYRVKMGEPSEKEEKVLRQLIDLMEVPDRDVYLTYQYLVKAQKR